MGHKNIGFIAQEVLQYFPEVVGGSEDTHYTMKYKEMIAACIEALKEQDQIITTLEERAEGLVLKAKEKGLL
jgi:DNA-binding LacI/PurR family transcriptional regulator